APGERGEYRIKACLGGDVGLDDEIAVEAFGERLDALAERLALIGKGQPGALAMQRLGDAPGEGAIIGDAHDEPLFPGQQAQSLTPSPRSAARERERAGPHLGSSS